MKELIIKPFSGYFMLLVCLLLIGGIGYGAFFKSPFLIISAALVLLFLFSGFFFINPNESRVLTLFGKYVAQ